ncbi:uncharacterized protein LOC113367775 [Ctenocephalides felis]|uniref:uncharacterized protein LOC113367775 n=1 Tax=Ctenocephalides felis TaxID=7515 RepID=UPI000E6E5BA2|nr:uncharacterized protein LOC113367775 [Ctenocephalides felis]
MDKTIMTDWCRLPSGVKCSCLLAGTPEYERLSPTQHDEVQATADLFRRMTAAASVSPENNDDDFGFDSGSGDYSEGKDSTNEKQEELSFHNDDGSYQLVTVERNLRAVDLCQLLAVKNRGIKDPKWTLYEHWPDLGLERPLEDHEDVLRTYREMQCFSKRARKRFVFRKDPRKYDYFADPQNFFPTDMMVASAIDDFINPIYTSSSSVFAQSSSANISTNPKFTLVGLVWIRAGPSCGNAHAQQRVWRQVLLLLAGSKLYYTREAETAARAVRDRERGEAVKDNKNFFPTDMMVASAIDDFINPIYTSSSSVFAQSSSANISTNPKFTLVGLVWIRAGPSCGNAHAQQRVWRQVLLLLAGSKLYYTREAETAARVVRDRERGEAVKDNKVGRLFI